MEEQGLTVAALALPAVGQGEGIFRTTPFPCCRQQLTAAVKEGHRRYIGFLGHCLGQAAQFGAVAGEHAVHRRWRQLPGHGAAPVGQGAFYVAVTQQGEIGHQRKGNHRHRHQGDEQYPLADA